MKNEREKTIRVGLVGDYDAAVRAHVAIPKALQLVARETGITIEPTWISTAELTREVEDQLRVYSGLWCVPASPYKNMEGALSAIRFARERGISFLGTCGGFQHALIEYTRNVLGVSEAEHAESNPQASIHLISPLSCSLVGAKGTIRLANGSLVRGIYENDTAIEEYHCNFGFNSDYYSMLESGELKVSGVDTDGDVRIVELSEHPFFVATLFQPELSALEDRTHPLIRAFTEAAATFQVNKSA
jgi:CTP synthase (UTP-ammonia lyase)